MKNAYAIMNVSRQLAKVCEQIECLSSGVQEMEQSQSDTAAVYQGLLLDEVEHAQVLTLELTKLIYDGEDDEPAANADGEGSVFAAGELTAEKGDQTDGKGEAEA